MMRWSCASAEFRFVRNLECAVCGEHPSITAPSDPQGFCTLEELQQVRNISPAQLAQALAAGAQPISLIDVREPAEFATGHLPRAINIPLAQIADNSAGLLNQPTVVFMCRWGPQSQGLCARTPRRAARAIATRRRTARLEGGGRAVTTAVDASGRPRSARCPAGGSPRST